MGDRVEWRTLERDVLEITAFERPLEYGEHFKKYYGPTIATRANAARTAANPSSTTRLKSLCDEWNRGKPDEHGSRDTSRRRREDRCWFGRLLRRSTVVDQIPFPGGCSQELTVPEERRTRARRRRPAVRVGRAGGGGSRPRAAGTSPGAGSPSALRSESSRRSRRSAMSSRSVAMLSRVTSSPTRSQISRRRSASLFTGVTVTAYGRSR